MALTPCTDLSAADWLTTSDLPWERLVTLGPSGFTAYARLRFIPDPAYDGQSENDVKVDDDHPSDLAQLCAVLEVLATHTTTPDDWYVAYWDGWPLESFPEYVLQAPLLHLPNRDYFLLRGQAADLTEASEVWPGHPNLKLPIRPAFVWPADRAWCVTTDVDPHWAGIGADYGAINELLAATNLDVVPTDFGAEQPHYR
ncbi:hypothetical protein KZX45_01155 [Georgenia sp. EYE_87]|uniref:hypothetical protein n=1 Tax=Georgenia sp. EYE_87 TaxID=2853448 RepID=UPI002002A9FF|nr:hypothetical protein [Georgenia sp. EYE_87]MCK6209150.1 hypothetical protein [Georgenia sp. EYE_87]